MNTNLFIKNGIIIPESEVEITTSRSGGAGGQHINKTDTRVTLRWNVKNTKALDDILKQRILQNFRTRLTSDGDLIIHSGESRSQMQNKEMVFNRFVQIVRKALHVPKRRMLTQVPKTSKASRLMQKTRRGIIKKLRKVKDYE